MTSTSQDNMNKEPGDLFYIRLRMCDEINDRYLDLDISRDILREAKRKNSKNRVILGTFLADAYQELITTR